jgi:hypothetical protein
MMTEVEPILLVHITHDVITLPDREVVPQESGSVKPSSDQPTLDRDRRNPEIDTPALGNGFRDSIPIIPQDLVNSTRIRTGENPSL